MGWGVDFLGVVWMVCTLAEQKSQKFDLGGVINFQDLHSYYFLDIVLVIYCFV